MKVEFKRAGTDETVGAYGDWTYALPRVEERILLPTGSWEITMLVHLPDQDTIWIGVRPFAEVQAENAKIVAELAALEAAREDRDEQSTEGDSGGSDED